jgi:hypothetical protein
VDKGSAGFRPRVWRGDHRPLTGIERAVWQAWNALGDDCEAPVKTIARDLNLPTGTVAAIVFPAHIFGMWADDQEPDL